MGSPQQRFRRVRTIVVVLLFPTKDSQHNRRFHPVDSAKTPEVQGTKMKENISPDSDLKERLNKISNLVEWRFPVIKKSFWDFHPIKPKNYDSNANFIGLFQDIGGQTDELPPLDTPPKRKRCSIETYAAHKRRRPSGSLPGSLGMCSSCQKFLQHFTPSFFATTPKCPFVCLATFYSISDLTAHLLSEHLRCNCRSYSFFDGPNAPLTSISKELKCPHCREEYGSHQEVEAHILRYHEVPSLAEVNTSKKPAWMMTIPTDYIGRQYSEGTNENSTFDCTKCSMEFLTREEYLRHIRSHYKTCTNPPRSPETKQDFYGFENEEFIGFCSSPHREFQRHTALLEGLTARMLSKSSKSSKSLPSSKSSRPSKSSKRSTSSKPQSADLEDAPTPIGLCKDPEHLDSTFHDCPLKSSTEESDIFNPETKVHLVRLRQDQMTSGTVRIRPTNPERSEPLCNVSEKTEDLEEDENFPATEKFPNSDYKTQRTPADIEANNERTSELQADSDQENPENLQENQLKTDEDSGENRQFNRILVNAMIIERGLIYWRNGDDYEGFVLQNSEKVVICRGDEGESVTFIVANEDVETCKDDVPKFAARIAHNCNLTVDYVLRLLETSYLIG